MSYDIEDLIGEFEAPVRSTTICKNGRLWAEYDELRDELESAPAGDATKMGETGARLEIAQRIQELEEQMRKDSVRFSFKGLGKVEFAALKKRFKADDGQREWDPIAGAEAFIAACSHEPRMTEEQVKRLSEKIGHGQLDKLFSAAFLATTDNTSVPKSVRASAVVGGNG